MGRRAGGSDEALLPLPRRGRHDRTGRVPCRGWSTPGAGPELVLHRSVDWWFHLARSLSPACSRVIGHWRPIDTADDDERSTAMAPFDVPELAAGSGRRGTDAARRRLSIVGIMENIVPRTAGE